MDFREIQDAYMRRRGLDYFENSRRAIYAQRAYAIANPQQCKDYGANVWGLTASDGPADVELENAGGKRRYRGLRRARRRGRRRHARRLHAGADRGGRHRLPFAPELAIPAVLDDAQALRQVHLREVRLPRRLQPELRLRRPAAHGRCIPGFGWVAGDYLGIDQGAIFAMIENYRSGMVWDVMRKNRLPPARPATRAGFTGGWLTASR